MDDVRHAAAFVIAALAPVLAAGAVPPYRAIDLGTLGGNYSKAEACNSKGEIVGRSRLLGSPFLHAFLFREGRMLDLGTLGGGASWAHDINDAGDIVGSSQGSDGDSHAFLYAEGEMLDLGTLGGRTSEALAINNAGEVVGVSQTVGGYQRAFLYTGGVMRDLGTLGGPTSAAHGINDAGEVVGISTTADGEMHAFLYADGVMEDIEPAGTAWAAADINNAGQAVGLGDYADGHMRAFVADDGTRRFLPLRDGWTDSEAVAINNHGQVIGEVMIRFEDTPGSWVTVARSDFLYADGEMVLLQDLLRPDDGGRFYLTGLCDINDHGQIVGSAWPEGTHNSHAVLLTPIPEPPAALLLAVALALLGRTRARPSRARWR